MKGTLSFAGREDMNQLGFYMARLGDVSSDMIFTSLSLSFFFFPRACHI